MCGMPGNHASPSLMSCGANYRYRPFSCDRSKILRLTTSWAQCQTFIKTIAQPFLITSLACHWIDSCPTLLAEKGASNLLVEDSNARIHGLPEMSRRRKLPLLAAPDRFLDSSPKRESFIICPPRNLQPVPWSEGQHGINTAWRSALLFFMNPRETSFMRQEVCQSLVAKAVSLAKPIWATVGWGVNTQNEHNPSALNPSNSGWTNLNHPASNPI